MNHRCLKTMVRDRSSIGNWELGFMGYPNYRVGNDGSVQSRGFRRNAYMGVGRWGDWKDKKPSVKRTALPSGHVDRRMVINLCHGNRFRTFRVHTLVLLAFVGPCPKGWSCCHNNGDATDNRLENLRWDTYSSNQLDRARHGTDARGIKNSNSKLTEEQVREIRKHIAEGKKNNQQIAILFGVSRASIRSIRVGKSWKYLT